MLPDRNIEVCADRVDPKRGIVPMHPEHVSLRRDIWGQMGNRSEIPRQSMTVGVTRECVPSTMKDSNLSSSRNRILLLSWCLPGMPTGSAVVVEELARRFDRCEMVVAGEDAGFPVPADWSSDLPEIIHVSKTRLRGNSCAGPIRRLIGMPAFVVRLLRLVDREKIRHLVVVFPSGYYLFAAWIVKNLRTVSLYPYLHNTFAENRKGWRLLLGNWLTKRLFKASSQVFVMSRGLVEFYEASYPGLRVSALPHAFSGEFPYMDQVRESESILRLGIHGSVNEGNADAVKRLLDAFSGDSDLEIVMYSPTSADELDRLGVSRSGMAHMSPADRMDVLRGLSTCDVVLLPHGLSGGFSDVEYATIFPTRTIDLLRCGRPILAHCPESSFLARFLTEHACAEVVTQADVEALRSALGRLLSDKAMVATLVANAQQTAHEFRGDRVAGILRAATGVGEFGSPPIVI